MKQYILVLTLFLLMLQLSLQNEEQGDNKDGHVEEGTDVEQVDSSAGSGPKTGGKMNTPLPYDCNAILLERIGKKCCKIPQFFPPFVASTCADREKPVTFKRRYRKYKRGPMCLHDCAFRVLNLLHDNEEESLNEKAIITKFLSLSSDAWKDVVKSAIISCNAAIKKDVSASVLLTTLGDNCTVAPLLFTKCLKKTILLACPDSAKEKDGGEECEKDMVRLRGCMPFFLTPQQNTSLARLRRPPGHFEEPHQGHNQGQNRDQHDADNPIPMEDNAKIQQWSGKNQYPENSKYNLFQGHRNGWGDKETKNVRPTTQFDEWGEMKDQDAKDAEDTTPWPYGVDPRRRNNFLPKFSAPEHNPANRVP